MTQTKKLTAGVPIVDSNGAVTPVSISELARQIGAAIGIQQREWADASGGKWYRIANVTRLGHTSAIIVLGHGWNSGSPSGLNLSFNASASGGQNTNSLIQLSGSGISFNKVRYVVERKSVNEGYGFIDIYIPSGKILPIKAAVFSNGGINLVDEITEAPQLTNEYVYELTPIKMGGGINATLTGRYMQKKGGSRHEPDENNRRVIECGPNRSRSFKYFVNLRELKWGNPAAQSWQVFIQQFHPNHRRKRNRNNRTFPIVHRCVKCAVRNTIERSIYIELDSFRPIQNSNYNRHQCQSLYTIYAEKCLVQLEKTRVCLTDRKEVVAA